MALARQHQRQRRSAYPWSIQCLLLPPPIFPTPSKAVPDSPSPFPRYGHTLSATTTASGELYLFGGLVRETAHNDLYIFSAHDLSATLVETCGETPSPRVGHASAFVSSVLIVWGGETNANPLFDRSEQHDDALYLLNLVSREWMRVVMRAVLYLLDAMVTLLLWSASNFRLRRTGR
ncbi:uncharacterized protein EDB91DRAFT_1269165 [Suillus paluster]|uniref:uncharacterized protein n=1 Tax=Suillus paluster TaxID=48578 RepID=UPI001B8750ED|nr:uncharacterized protein EDB91DRAFT_1269165 [Suillus paluster]KAG1724438.1 hypothetical protein EDB91DRAFT_1269165 [Suillus paluster]